MAAGEGGGGVNIAVKRVPNHNVSSSTVKKGEEWNEARVVKGQEGDDHDNSGGRTAAYYQACPSSYLRVCGRGSTGG